MHGATDDELLFGIYGRILRFGCWGIEYVQARAVADSLKRVPGVLSASQDRLRRRRLMRRRS